MFLEPVPKVEYFVSNLNIRSYPLKLISVDPAETPHKTIQNKFLNHPGIKLFWCKHLKTYLRYSNRNAKFIENYFTFPKTSNVAI